MATISHSKIDEPLDFDGLVTVWVSLFKVQNGSENQAAVPWMFHAGMGC